MKCKISDICNINNANISKKDNYQFINYLDTSNLTEGVIDDLQKLIIGKDKIPSRAKRKVKRNDILISTVRPNQKHYGIIKDEEENLIVSTGFAVLSANNNIVDSGYLYRFLTQDLITNYLQAIGETSTSTYPSIKPSDIANLNIDLPPLEEQKSIANILSTLDEKIEVNNQINKKLEEMAQAIFKRWFADFEFPDENGNPYKSSGGEMIESEMGMIPKGWKIEELGTIIKVCSGKRPKEKNSFMNSDFTIPLIGASSVMGYVKEANFNNDILIIGRVGTLGIVQRFNGDIWASDNTLVIKTAYNEFVNQILNRIDYKSLNRGSTQPLITQGDIKKEKIILPSSNIIDRFEKSLESLFVQRQAYKKENNILIKIRDTLLPKLMSGEIRVQLNNEIND